MTQYKKGRTMRILTARDKARLTLKELGYNHKTASNNLLDVVAWTIDDKRTAEELDKMLLFIKTLNGGNK